MTGRARHKEQGTPILEISLSSPAKAAACQGVKNIYSAGPQAGEYVPPEIALVVL